MSASVSPWKPGSRSGWRAGRAGGWVDRGAEVPEQPVAPGSGATPRAACECVPWLRWRPPRALFIRGLDRGRAVCLLAHHAPDIIHRGFLGGGDRRAAHAQTTPGWWYRGWFLQTSGEAAQSVPHCRLPWISTPRTPRHWGSGTSE